jgi:ribosomal protein S27E
MTTDPPRQQFTCPACGHVTAFDPACCWRGIETRRDEGGRQETTRFLLVRCAGCGRQEEVPTGPG